VEHPPGHEIRIVNSLKDEVIVLELKLAKDYPGLGRPPA
jgi:hypothetical protein